MLYYCLCIQIKNLKNLFRFAEFQAGIIDHRCQSIAVLEPQYFGVTLVKPCPGVGNIRLKRLAGVCGIHSREFTVGLPSEVALVNHRIDEACNRRGCQMKLPAKFLLAYSGTVVDQHHQEGVRGRKAGGPEFFVCHAADHARQGVGRKVETVMQDVRCLGHLYLNNVCTYKYSVPHRLSIRIFTSVPKNVSGKSFKLDLSKGHRSLQTNADTPNAVTLNAYRSGIDIQPWMEIMGNHQNRFNG